MAARQGRFLTGATMGHVVRMTMTGALGITFVFLVDLANLFWISQLGDNRLVAAIGFAFAIQFFSVSSAVGLMVATTALVSRRIGMGEPDRARHEATSAMMLAMGFQAVVAVLVVTFRYPLLEMAGAEGETLALAARYLAITVPSLVIMAAGMAASAALRAEGDGTRAMLVTLTSGCVSMILDPLLIIGFDLGLDGAALVLLLSRTTIAIMALRFAIGTHDLLAQPSLWAIRRSLWPFFAVAAPAMLTQMATPFGNYLVTTVIAEFGDGAVAGWAVVSRVTVVAYGGVFSLAGAIGGIFGQNYGAKQYDRLRSTYRDALIFCAAYTLIVWAALLASVGLVIDAFAIPAPGVPVYRAFATVEAGAFILAGATFVANAAFNNLGRPVRSMTLNWLRDGVLLLPLAWWFTDLFAAPGAIYARAFAGLATGAVAVLWGWVYVQRIGRSIAPRLDLTARRGYRDVNRFRRR